MRATEGFQTTINLSPVNCEDQTLSLELELKMALPMPNQDEHLPDQIETVVHQAGLEAQRRLFQALLEKADQQLVLQRRRGKGGAGIHAPWNTALHLQDDLWRGYRSAVANPPQLR